MVARARLAGLSISITATNVLGFLSHKKSLEFMSDSNLLFAFCQGPTGTPEEETPDVRRSRKKRMDQCHAGMS